jgi:hypothetical protein
MMNSTNPEGRCGGRKRWLFPFFFAGILLIKSAVGFFLWNALIPDLFHGPVLTFWQVAGLLILVKLFIHGRPGGHGHGPFGRHFKGHWQSLSPEEKQKMRDEIHSQRQ